MGRHAKDNAQRIGPRLWARFLKRHFKSPTLAPLNAQLLLPITPCEIFEFGVNPPPLPLRLAPRIFERAYDLGRSPDGVYTPEVYGPDSKSGRHARFNLYERVTQRVPASKFWLLKEVEPFLQEIPPTIDATVRLLNELLDELDLVLVEGEAIAAWECVDPAGVRAAEMNSASALSGGELPEYVALAYALTHLCVWTEPPRLEDRLSNSLLFWCRQVASNFETFLQLQNFDFGDELAFDLASSLAEGVATIGVHGARSMNLDLQSRPPNLTGRLVLAPNTEETRRAIRCLREAVELQQIMRRPWPEYCTNTPEQWKANPPRNSGLEPPAATQQLSDAASLVPAQLKARTQRILGKYRHMSLSGRAPHPAAFFSFSFTHDSLWEWVG